MTSGGGPVFSLPNFFRNSLGGGLLFSGKLHSGFFCSRCGNLCLNFAEHLDQLFYAAPRNVHKVDSDGIPPIHPLDCATEPEGDAFDLECDLDMDAGACGKPLQGAHPAPLKAQIHDPALHRETMAHQKRNNTLIHSESRTRAALFRALGNLNIGLC